MDIVKMYKSGMTMEEIAKQVGVSRITIGNRLNKLGVETRKTSSKWKINENYFEVIDTEEKAYWLGFIYADGYINNNGRYALEIGLNKADRGHLEKFLKAIESTHPIEERKTTSSVRVNISNKKLVQDLGRHGVHPNKSGSTIFPIHLEEELVRHFMRGYFDGDGTLSVKPEKKRYRAIIIGTPNFLHDFQQHLPVNITRLMRDKRWKGNTAYIEKSGINTCYKVTHFLYDKATIYLDRKYEEYCKLIAVLRGNS